MPLFDWCQKEGNCFKRVQFSLTVMSDSLQLHGLQHASPSSTVHQPTHKAYSNSCPSPTHEAYSNSCLSSQWCHPTILCRPFFHLKSFPISRYFQMSQFFASGGQSIGASASALVFPMNVQDWLPLGWTGGISLQSKGFSRVFSITKVQKHQFFHAQLSL